MAKIKSFADKMSKDKKDFTTHCQKCGESITTVKLVASELSEKTGAYRFKQSFVGVCKCNENNVLEPIVRNPLTKPKSLQAEDTEPAVTGQPEEAKPSESVDEPVVKGQSEEVKAPESGDMEPEAKSQTEEANAPESGDTKS